MKIKLKKMTPSKFLSFIPFYKEKDRVGRYHNLERDWQILLGLFFIFVIGISIYSFSFFLRVNVGGVNSGEDDQSVSIDSIDRKKLSDAVKKYEQALVQYEDLRRRPPVTPRP